MPPARRQPRSRKPAPRAGPRGFTLIELGVVIGLSALMVGVVIPSLSAVSGATARSSVSALVSNIRAARDKAAAMGGTCRVAFELEANQYGIECADTAVTSVGVLDPDDVKTPEEIEDLDEEERYEYEIKQKVVFNGQPVFGPVPLEGGVKFHEVDVQHLDEPQKKGTVFLYFFSSGLGERANIQLSRGDDEEWSLLVSPLANRIQVVQKHVRLRDLDDED